MSNCSAPAARPSCAASCRKIRPGLHAADVMTTSDPAASAKLAKDGIFVPFKPEAFDKVPDVAKDPDGAYVAQRLNMMVIYVRSDKVAKADYPKTWTDVLDPKYKDKLVMTDPSFTALQLMVVSTLSHKLGWSYYEKLKANNIMIVQSNQQVTRRHQALRTPDRRRRARQLRRRRPQAGPPDRDRSIRPTAPSSSPRRPRSSKADRIRTPPSCSPISWSAKRRRSCSRSMAAMPRAPTSIRRPATRGSATSSRCRSTTSRSPRMRPSVKKKFNEVFQ